MAIKTRPSKPTTDNTVTWGMIGAPMIEMPPITRLASTDISALKKLTIIVTMTGIIMTIITQTAVTTTTIK